MNGWDEKALVLLESNKYTILDDLLPYVLLLAILNKRGAILQYLKQRGVSLDSARSLARAHNWKVDFVLAQHMTRV